MANTANATLTTNFNVSPYYDDYDENRFYYRMLFKPGYAVQARELTQMQTMLQKQIDRFGKHVFREGSIVLPGEFSIETELDYVKIKDVDGANNAVNVNDYLNLTLTGQTNNVQAYVVNVLDGSESDANTKTLYVRYQSGSDSNTEIKTFAANEVLVSNTLDSLTVASSNPTGKAARFVIREGVFFAKEHFIKFATQSIIIGRYDSLPTCRVGFKVVESIVNATSDTSLLDPALEASNYYAPGADRLKLTPELEVRDIDDETGAPEFVELFTIRDGVITEIYERSQYNILQDELAKRTMDESGDYYVRGLSLRIRENLDTGDNGGLSNTGNSQLLSFGVEPGVAYVKGYEVNKLVTDYVEVRKALDYSNVSSQIGTVTMGNYVTLTQVSGAPVADKGSEISLYDTAASSISNKTFSATPTGNVIGTARISSFTYDSDTLGTANGAMLLYLNEIKMTGSNTFSNVRSVFLNNAGARANLVGDVLLANNNGSVYAILNDVRAGALLYPVGSAAVKTVRETNGDGSMQFNFLRTADVTVTGATGLTTVTISTGAENESMPYGTTSGLSDADKREIIVTLNQDTTITGVGTANGAAGTNILYGSGGADFNRFNVGDKLSVAGKSNVFIIGSITSSGILTLTENLPAGVSGNAYSKVYKAGDIIDLTSKGFDAGVERVVSTTPTQLTIDLKETFGSDISATVTYQAVRSTAKEIAKDLRPSRYVKINCASSGVTGPFNLGFSDIYRVRNIVIKTDGTFPANTADGSVVTNNFEIDNGQRDTYYDHGAITPKTRLTTDTRILVELDYFLPVYSEGKGYFSVDSYPVDDTTESDETIRTEDIPIFTSPRDKSIYNLRNLIDLRPVKQNSATDTTNPASASENPAASTSFYYDSNGIRLPVPSTQYDHSYSFYYPRRDLVVIDKDGFVNVIAGNPTNAPITPTTPENMMSLASVFITPYPSLAPNYAKIINRPDLACVVKKLSNVRFTMREIGLLKQRIENLEYYASLSLLEKSAAELRILDENGLERFKNGIFVDTFADHNLGDRANPNYRIVVDPVEKVIRPIYTMNSVGYDYNTGSNVRKTGDLITLDYSEKIFIEQNVATSFRNVELTSYRFLGEVFMTPDTDVWVDTEFAPDENIVTGDLVANTSTTQSLGVTWGNWQTTWNSWQTSVTGYEAYNSKGQLVGTYATQAQAEAQFDSDRSVQLTATSKFLPPSGGQTYGTVTNVYVSGRFYASYALSPGDGMIYKVTTGRQSGVSTRTGSETFLTTTTTATETTEQIGSKLLDVGLIPYIKPQTIKVHARGLKPRTRVFVYFDSEAMSSYCTPISSSEYNTENFVGASIGSEGGNLVTDASGDIYFKLRLPAGGTKNFRVGTKELVVTDSPTNAIDASTKAIGYFVAHGLVQQKQNTILTTRGSTTTTSTSTRTVSQSKNVANTAVISKEFVGFVEDISCSAYSFLPKAPPGEEGLFITSVDIFFAAKHPTFGVWVEIREMDNAGGITRNQVPFSEVWLTPDEMVTSDDASLAQHITFPSPVFLYSDKQYAFVIHTVAINPDTYIWISRLGETDIKTGTQYTSRTKTGTFYTTNNNLNWDMVPDIDLKIRFYRAEFVTNTQGSAYIGNKPVEELILSNTSSSIDTFGEVFRGRPRLSLTGNTGSIVVGDRLIGANSGANAAVITANGSVFTVANTLFLTNERVTITHANAVSKNLTSVINNIDIATGVLKRSKSRGDVTYTLAEFVNSNGKFTVGDVITGLTSGDTATVSEIRNQRYSVVDFEPAFLTFNKTTIGFQMQTTSNTQVLDAFVAATDNENVYYSTEKALLSRSNEVAALASKPSNNVQVNMSTTTSFLSPVVDIARTHSIYVDNIVNANTYMEKGTGLTITITSTAANIANINVSDVLVGANSGANTSVLFRSGNNLTLLVPNTEFSIGERVNVFDQNVSTKNTSVVITNIAYNNIRNGGELFNKYISTPITLAEGQDAEDLLVLLTAYRPPGTEVKVWAKILNNEDGDSFANLPWIELEQPEQKAYSSLSNQKDFTEIRYSFPESQKTGVNGEVQYKNSAGITFTGFKYYALKIGLLADNSAVVPRVGDLRSIAIQI